MELCLEANPAVRGEYRALQQKLQETPPGELEPLLRRLRELVCSLKPPEEIGKAIRDFFGPTCRLAVRSSANGEDLENLRRRRLV